MKTVKRICVEDLEVTGQTDHGQEAIFLIKRGTEYLTSEEKDGNVTVLSTYWVKVPVKIFAGEVPGPGDPHDEWVYSVDGVHKSNDPKLVAFHNTREKPAKVICIKDNPDMHGFGKSLKKGDVVEINGTTHEWFGWAVCVPEQCAFYDYNCFDLA